MTVESAGPRPRVREVEPGDVERVAVLATQLGYPTTAVQARDRLRLLAEFRRGCVLVAEADDRVIGWIHVAAENCLEAEPWAEIRGLVVDEAWRSRGVGGELVRSAEDWGRRQGLPLLRLRTNVLRERAHDFYRRLGFRLLKTQHVFVKDVGSAESTPGEVDS